MALVEKATQQIKDMIIAKDYDDEGYLPPEGELCVMFGVSRATIREAVRSLEVRGLVQRIHGKGVKVVDHSIHALTQTLSDIISVGECSVENLIEVRHAIETTVARLAVTRATQEDLRDMNAAIRNMEQAQVMDDAYIQADLDFHLAMVRASKNPLFNAIVEAYTPLLMDTIIAASQSDEVIERKHRYHRNIADAIAERDEERAEECIRIHLAATERNVKNVSED